MKITRIICVLVVLLFLFSGCAYMNRTQLSVLTEKPGEVNSVISKDGDITMTKPTDETTANSANDVEIVFGRIYSIQEYMPIFEKIQTCASEQLNYMNEHFEEGILSGKILQTISFNYNGKSYELTLNCDKYSFLDHPSLKYQDHVHKISLIIDAETMGSIYYKLATGAFSCTFPVTNLEKKTEEELIGISNEFFDLFFKSKQIDRDEYTVLFDLLDYENPHVDNNAKLYMIQYSYNNDHSLYSRLAYMTIDEYGFITTATFNADQYYLDKEFLSRLPAIDYDKLLLEAERYREPHCDCGLSIQTRVTKRVIDGRELAQLQITIVPDEKGSTEHIHDYINNSLFIFYELTD